MNQIGAALRALRPAKFVATHGKWKDELREHEEITRAALLNEATKKAIVTDMAPPELATHLKLNADRHTTDAQMMAIGQPRQSQDAESVHGYVD